MQEMAHVVKLVAPLLSLRLHSFSGMFADEVGVQVSVRFLRGYYVLRDFVHRGAELGTVAGLQNKAGGLHPLVNIGIGVHGPALRCSTLAVEAAEIVHPSVGFQQFAHGRNALVDVDFAALRPKTILDRDGVHWYVSQFGVRRLGEIENALVPPRWSSRQNN